jgi:pilus assembly protein CpaB
MSVRQIIVLGVALIAALGALFVVRTMAGSRQKEQVVATVADVGPRVLVAARDVAAGIALQPADLEWRVWAQTSLSPAFIEEKEDARAVETFTGAVTRQALVAGEPIVSERVVQPGAQGFMAAILKPGWRAVAIAISAESAVAGFIMPNDRVDVILTRKVQMNGGASEEARSDIILQDVRVLAIEEHFRQPSGDDADDPIRGDVATLELSPRDSETLALADELGDITLALRGVEREQADLKGAPGSSARRGAPALAQGNVGDEIRVHAFGAVKQQTVSKGGAN